MKYERTRKVGFCQHIDIQCDLECYRACIRAPFYQAEYLRNIICMHCVCCGIFDKTLVTRFGLVDWSKSRLNLRTYNIIRLNLPKSKQIECCCCSQTSAFLAALTFLKMVKCSVFPVNAGTEQYIQVRIFKVTKPAACKHQDTTFKKLESLSAVASSSQLVRIIRVRQMWER